MRLEIIIDFQHLEDWWLSLLIAGLAIFITLRWDSLVSLWHSKARAKDDDTSDDDIIAAVRGAQKNPMSDIQTNVKKMLNGEKADMNQMFDGFFGALNQVLQTSQIDMQAEKSSITVQEIPDKDECKDGVCFPKE